MVALCHTKEQAEQVKARMASWLAPRGLSFNEAKTRIVTLVLLTDLTGASLQVSGTMRRVAGSFAA
jgi:RNA-directed DNA polymerase